MLASTAILLPAAAGCGGGKLANAPGKAAVAQAQDASHAGKSGDWCSPMPQPDDKCGVALKECMVTCDYISDRCALLVCMGSKWTYVEEQDESAANK